MLDILSQSPAAPSQHAGETLLSGAQAAASKSSAVAQLTQAIDACNKETAQATAQNIQPVEARKRELEMQLLHLL